MKPIGRLRVRRTAAARTARRPVLRDLIDTHVDGGVVDEILDTVTGPFGRVVAVDDAPAPPPLRRR